MSQAYNVIVGTKQTIKALKNGEVKEIVVADDADSRIIYKVVQTAKDLQVNVTQVDSMKKLGKACGIDVGAAVVAIII